MEGGDLSLGPSSTLPPSDTLEQPQQSPRAQEDEDIHAYAAFSENGAGKLILSNDLFAL